MRDYVPSIVRLYLYICLCGLFFLAPSWSYAKKKASDSGVQNLLKIAEKLYVEGIRLAQQKKFEEALAKFRASYRIVPPANEAKNNHIRGILHLLIGRTYHRMKQWSKARDHYRKYLKILRKDARRAKVKRWLHQLYPHLSAHLNVQMQPTGSCSVLHPRASWKGKVPARIQVESGRITLECSSPGYKMERRQIQIRPKQNYTLKFKLLPLPKPPPDLRWVAFSIGGLGVAMVATGAVLGGLALMHQNEAFQVLDGATDGHESGNAWDLYRNGQQKAGAANVLYASGGGVVLTSILLYFVFRPKVSHSKQVRNTVSKHTLHSKKSTHLYTSSVFSIVH